jgi:hypothetical protein
MVSKIFFSASLKYPRGRVDRSYSQCYPGHYMSASIMQLPRSKFTETYSGNEYILFQQQINKLHAGKWRHNVKKI